VSTAFSVDYESDECERGLRRRCCVRRCPEPAQLGGSKRGALCLAHHAARMRLWRARRRAAGKSVSGASKTAPSSSAEATRARKALSRVRRTGAVTPEPCRACRSVSGVVATHPDPDLPSTIVWACRACRSQLVAGTVERKRDDARELVQQRAQAEFAELCGIVVTVVDALPAVVAAGLRAAAATGYSWPARPGSPLWVQRLARSYSGWLETVEPPQVSKSSGITE
jgi:hypothetical protein